MRKSILTLIPLLITTASCDSSGPTPPEGNTPEIPVPTIQLNNSVDLGSFGPLLLRACNINNPGPCKDYLGLRQLIFEIWLRENDPRLQFPCPSGAVDGCGVFAPITNEVRVQIDNTLGGSTPSPNRPILGDKDTLAALPAIPEEKITPQQELDIAQANVDILKQRLKFAEDELSYLRSTIVP